MNWFYICPHCKEWRSIRWEERQKSYYCKEKKMNYIPPTPAEQTSAYVDTQEWPMEIEEVVVATKGRKCIVPGCKSDYQTLDHRIPYSKKGHTSVDNLFPMCTEHHKLKGDTDYERWLMIKVH
ncbi:MAG: HNH endonuclease signature motif containing protein [Candidatus Kryptoniota bacterium]